MLHFFFHLYYSISKAASQASLNNNPSAIQYDSTIAVLLRESLGSKEQLVQMREQLIHVQSALDAESGLVFFGRGGGVF